MASSSTRFGLRTSAWSKPLVIDKEKKTDETKTILKRGEPLPSDIVQQITAASQQYEKQNQLRDVPCAFASKPFIMEDKQKSNQELLLQLHSRVEELERKLQKVSSKN